MGIGVLSTGEGQWVVSFLLPLGWADVFRLGEDRDHL